MNTHVSTWIAGIVNVGCVLGAWLLGHRRGAKINFAAAKCMHEMAQQLAGLYERVRSLEETRDWLLSEKENEL